MNNFRSLLILLVFYLSAAYVVYWGITENFGYLRILSEKSLNITIAGSEIDCPKFPCRLKIRPGTYNLSLEHKNEFKKHYRVTITRGHLAKVEYKSQSKLQLQEGQTQAAFNMLFSENSSQVQAYSGKTIARFNTLYHDLDYALNQSNDKALFFSVAKQAAFVIDLKALSKKSVDLQGLKFLSMNLINDTDVLIQTQDGVFQILDGDIVPSLYKQANFVGSLDEKWQIVISALNLSKQGKQAQLSVMDLLSLSQEATAGNYYLYLLDKETKQHFYLRTLQDFKPNEIGLSKAYFQNKLHSVLQLKHKSFIMIP